MRFVTTTVVLSFVSLAWTNVPAYGLDANANPTALAALEAKADQAQPKDQCFLYAELVNQMTDLAGQQFRTGDSEHASQTLKLVQRYAEKVRAGMADDSKKLKNAELLLERTTFRMKDILDGASSEDRQPLQATLEQLRHVQVQLMMEVFKK